MSDSANRSAAASDVSGSSRLPSTIEKSHLADSGNDSFTSSDCELPAGGGDHSRESPQPQPARHIVAPLQDHLVHATADLAPLAENDDRSRVLKNCIFHWFWALFRNFCKTEKFSQVQNFLRIFTVAPCKYTGDHRQIMGIMGRSWAVSRIFPKLCPNCTKSLYNHQRRSGAQK